MGSRKPIREFQHVLCICFRIGKKKPQTKNIAELQIGAIFTSGEKIVSLIFNFLWTP